MGVFQSVIADARPARSGAAAMPMRTEAGGDPAPGTTGRGGTEAADALGASPTPSLSASTGFPETRPAAVPSEMKPAAAAVHADNPTSIQLQEPQAERIGGETKAGVTETPQHEGTPAEAVRFEHTYRSEPIVTLREAIPPERQPESLSEAVPIAQSEVRENIPRIPEVTMTPEARSVALPVASAEHETGVRMPVPEARAADVREAGALNTVPGEIPADPQRVAAGPSAPQRDSIPFRQEAAAPAVTEQGVRPVTDDATALRSDVPGSTPAAEAPQRAGQPTPVPPSPAEAGGPLRTAAAARQPEAPSAVEREARLVETRPVNHAETVSAGPRPQEVRQPRSAAPTPQPPSELRIGQIDVFVEKAAPAPTRGGGSARPSVSLASRHYLRRL